MERITFFAASAAFCLFLTVALGSAMTTDCLCDGLPGDQCDYCDHPAAEEQAASADLNTEEKNAWIQEHEDFHQRWVEMHAEYHTVPRTDAEEAAFHVKMEEAAQTFHATLQQAGVPVAH